MNIAEIEKNLEKLVRNLSNEEFIFDLLLAYGTPRATVTLLKKGRHNLSKQDGQIILKKKLFFQEVNGHDLHETIDNLSNNVSTMRHSPRFIIVTDYSTLLAVDTKNRDQLDIEMKNIIKHYDFFLPWAGIEKHNHTNDNPADRKAAEKMAKLYDGILADNNISNEKKTHDLNVFLARLLFCFFAEDTSIFGNKLFTDSIASHTQNDGSDLSAYLDSLFNVLNSKERSNYPQYLQKFPYVNGGLFAEKHWIPEFTLRSRRIIIECGELDWSKINPDIFGSMIQAVVHPGERKSLGMHYTSVPNIMKVIEPLFLNDLREAFERNKGNKNKLHELLIRLSNIKFFDPACGSGNFLIITYKELRRLEMAVIKDLGSFAFPSINLSQFYGLEIDHFAHEIAKLSMYLAEHQMNIEFQNEFGKVTPPLPLKTGGNITCANATRINWTDVCRKKVGDEIYVMGNPPYLGSSMQSIEQKDELKNICKDFDHYKNLDYISCWFIKGAEYIKGLNAQLAFVSTNSICQGEQVSLLWPHILETGLEIGFAHTSFKWTNNAKGNAGVTVIVVGLRNIFPSPKFLITTGHSRLVSNINAYITAGRNIFIPRRSSSLSNLPEMIRGSTFTDNGHLILNTDEKNKLISAFPEANKFVKKLIGSSEYIRGTERWCLYIRDINLADANKIPEIRKRLELVSAFRKTSKAACTIGFANSPHKLKQDQFRESPAIITPRVSSERREYIPCGFLDTDIVIPDSAQAIYNPEPWIFGVISSRIHMVWVRAVGGRLKTDYRYSSQLCYNTFPISSLTTKQKEVITHHVYTILEERENHSEKNMAQLYDPDKMPTGLREAHHQLDLAVERCYRSKVFTSDEERLEVLFKLYEQMITEKKVKQSKE